MQRMGKKGSLSRRVVSASLPPYGLLPTRLTCPWASPDQNAGVRCHSHLQGIFLIQGSNSCLLCPLHWQADSLPSEPPGKGVSAPPSYPTSRPFCGASGFRDFVLLLKSSRALLIFLKQINFNLL